MPTPGLLFRLTEPKQNNVPLDPKLLAPGDISPRITEILSLKAQDDKTPVYNTAYFLADIDPLLGDQGAELYEKDKIRTQEAFTTLDWLVLSFINGHEKDDVPVSQLPKGTVIVSNGNTPQPDKEQDYHNWYDQEHGAKLAKVPGWRKGKRYALVRNFGSGEDLSTFVGVNFYDEENRLGGPEWQAGVTEWTMRIRSNSAKPNHRRVWRVV